MKVYVVIESDTLGGYSSEVQAVCASQSAADQEVERLAEEHAQSVAALWRSQLHKEPTPEDMTGFRQGYVAHNLSVEPFDLLGYHADAASTVTLDPEEPSAK